DDKFQHIEILKPAFDLSQSFNSAITVVLFSKQSETSEMILDARTLQFVEKKFKTAYREMTINFLHLTGEDLLQTLHDFVTEKKIDLLVMITRKRNFLQNFLDNSVTQKMSYYITVPLLSLHQED
ncbi:MAG: universal stress protein, partial [Flavitalea sp.]